MKRADHLAVDIEHLTVHFGSLVAVDDLSMSVAPGEVFAMLGRNGSGKSTTVRCVLGQLKAKGGATRVFGLDSWRKRAQVMERTGFVPETPDVPPQMTASALSVFAARVHDRFDARGYRDRLQRFSIAEHRPFKNLSKGQQKQVSLALALATAPDLLILDDPTLGLDAVARKVLFEEVVGELADRGTTILVTTHDLAAVEGVADKVGIIHDGRLVLDEALQTLKTRFRRVFFERGVTDGEPFRSLHVAAGGLEPKVVGDTVSAVLTRCDAVDLSQLESMAVRSESLDLEEIFVEVCESEKGALR